MKKLIATAILGLLLNIAFGQSGKKVTAFILSQFNQTIYDNSISNNLWGLGAGAQFFYNNQSNFKPTVELTGDLYLENDKVLRTNPDGTVLETANGMVNLFAGTSYFFTKHIFASAVAGPSFINQQFFVGIKPSIGFYFSANKKWMGKLSFLNIFNRDNINHKDFGALSFAIGFRLF